MKAYLSRVLFSLCRLLLRPFLVFVKPKLVPADTGPLLREVEGKPVCYVLRQHNWSDRVVLEQLCRRHGLPLLRATPGSLPDSEAAACLYLPALGQVQNGTPGDVLPGLMDAAAADTDYALQIVPVSIFWGRDPGTETSLFKLLLGDAERAGTLRKLLIMLVQGRHVLVNVAPPVDFRRFIERQPQPAKAARVMHRMLSFHFQRQKAASLGPTLVSRQQMINAVLRRQTVLDAVQDLVNEGSLNEDKARRQARRMAEEVAANFDVRMLRFLDIVLSKLFSKLFTGVHVRHIDRLRLSANRHHLIYMPSHRSHLDYLLISYTLYWQGLVPPHIAAGVNLNFWPIGGLLRRGGAFYIRRSFNGQPLYTAVFKAYLDVLLARGYPLEFFPEGGRSRTGRLLPPKKGMLAMLVESFLDKPGRAAALVPVYVGYDKLVESGSYLKELRGSAKRRESAVELLKARRIFKASYGSPHVAFGEPLVLDEQLSRLQPDWRLRQREGDRSWLPAVVEQLAQLNMERINQAVIVNPVGLVAMILLASPQKAMAEFELLEQIERFRAILQTAPYSSDMVLPDGDAADLFEQAARTAGLSRIDHDWGPIVTATGNEAVMLTYYRNCIMHAFALPSLIARFFRHNAVMDEQQLQRACLALYPFLRRELFMYFSREECAAYLPKLIDALVGQGLLRRDSEGLLLRPDTGSSEYASLIGLGRILREPLERYTMTSLLLVQQLSRKPGRRIDFELHATRMAQRLAILSGREAPEYFDKTLFRLYLDGLIAEQLVSIEGDGDEACLRVGQPLRKLAEQWIELLGPNVQQSMQQLLHDPRLALSN